MPNLRVLGTDYRFFYKMVMRFYRYFEAIDYGKTFPRPLPPEFRLMDIDIVLSFFTFCYHLKDWLVKETWTNNVSDAGKKNIIDQHINNTPLKYCADICNGIKHFDLNDRRRNYNPPHFSKLISSVIVKDGHAPRYQARFILSNTGGLEAFSIAKDCVEAWRMFIKTNIDPTGSFEKNIEAGAAPGNGPREVTP